jgi:hypothetical protein
MIGKASEMTRPPNEPSEMTKGRNKYQSRENRAEVRKLLLREWDPIGVKHVPEASDEYDAYVGEVYVMLMDDLANAAAIEARLWDIATGHMGITPAQWLRDRCATTALQLVGIRPSFGTH